MLRRMAGFWREGVRTIAVMENGVVAGWTSGMIGESGRLVSRTSRMKDGEVSGMDAMMERTGRTDGERCGMKAVRIRQVMPSPMLRPTIWNGEHDTYLNTRLLVAAKSHPRNSLLLSNQTTTGLIHHCLDIRHCAIAQQAHHNHLKLVTMFPSRNLTHRPNSNPDLDPNPNRSRPIRDLISYRRNRPKNPSVNLRRQPLVRLRKIAIKHVHPEIGHPVLPPANKASANLATNQLSLARKTIHQKSSSLTPRFATAQLADGSVAASSNSQNRSPH